MDAPGLLAVSQVCKAFRAFDSSSKLRLVESVARTQAVAASSDQSGRWRRRSWLTRLFIEDSGVGFSNFKWASSSPAAAGVPPQYKFMPPTAPGSYLNIKLEGMGPKLLVSDLSTADQPVLRWRLVVRGNTAVEFGVVPLSMVDDDKSLHKCHQEEKKFERLRGKLADAERPTGFCSSITVGSMLPFKTAIMKGSVVELLARRGRLEILVQNPPDGQELYWHNTRTVPKPYKGPREVRFEQDFSPNHDVKLALTSWAHGAFDVLHPAPGSRLLGQDMQLLACLQLAPPFSHFVRPYRARSSTQAIVLNGNCKELFSSRLTDVQVVALCEALRGSSPARLVLSYNELGNTAAKAVAQLMQPCSDYEDAAEGCKQGLLELELSSNQITAEGAAALADALAQPECTLQRLVLSHNALGGAGITTLSEALQHNTSLRHLDISNTQPTEKGVISLAVTLADHNRSLTSLRLASPLLQQRPQQDTTTHLAHMLARNSSLQELQLSKAGLTDDALECLVQYGLLRGGAVQRLDLSANRFSSLAGQHIRLLLSAGSCSLRHLNLSSIRLQDEAALHIAACLPSCTDLEHLDLSSCSIGDKGLAALIAAAGKAGPKLRVLKLWGNGFGGSSSQALHLLRQQRGREGLVADVTTYVVDGAPCVAQQDAGC
ncbi:hypothetical protein OEZ85_006550 [Tetradesmus obliquus]|uniref:Uncharacterized protein n=1 Tax=Tetradesmus obliquus TaxID=3088 RepID=A0ABY8TVP3_TETOB|nr:hypothetical protein OEZ85_006550 [Tetradesmus obliquus]